VTEASDPELFFALPWSVGTAGFLLSIKVRLVRVKPYVRVMYEATNSAAELQQRMTDLSRMGADAPVFLEATMYSAERAVIQAGWYAGEARACHPELLRMRSYLLDLVAQGLKGRALRLFGVPCELCVLDLQGGGVGC
jgi:hypothetical protein